MDSSNDNANLPSAEAASSSSTSAAAAASSSKTVSEHLAQTLHTLDQLTTIFSFPHHLAKLAIDTCGPEDITTCYNWILDNHSNEVEDCGGPVVPINDCPHINDHVKFAIIDDKMQLVNTTDNIANDTNNNGSISRSSSLTNCCQEFTNLCCIDETSDIMTANCQYYSECNMKNKRIGSRKRLRSEDEQERIGQLKCDEDYEKDTCTKVTTGEEKQLTCPSGENWLCLECGALMCSRYANGHAKLHYEDTKEEEKAAAAAADGGGIGGGEGGGDAVGHCIAVSLADLSVWCYECNAYLHHPKLNELTKHLEKIKFGKEEVDESEAAKNGEDDENGASKMAIESTIETAKPSPINKRKSQPQKLPPEQIGTDVMVSSTQTLSNQNNSDDNDKKKNGNESESINSNDDDSRVDEINSSDDESDEQAAMIASLLHSEHGEALRAYLARFESYDTSDMGQCVPMNMPKPPTFPDEVADFLQSPMCKSIIVLAGAGMSVSSGIPDFRSAGVGLYDTLRPELLTASELEQALIEDDPTLALDKGMFLENPLPMLETKRSFILGTYERKWRATLAHRFVEMLHTKLGKLTRLYTQNIDGLEMQTQLPKEKVVPVHGTMAAAACEMCGEEMDFDEFCGKVRTNIKDITGLDYTAPAQSTPIVCQACQNPTMKPTIVLFRGQMPADFHIKAAQDLPDCDLLIIMGTSLTVAPANSLVYRIPPTALRMVMNNEPVGRRLGIDYSEESLRDVWASGYTDESCLNLAEKLGWLDDLAGIVNELPDSSAELLRGRLAQRQEEDSALKTEEE